VPQYKVQLKKGKQDSPRLVIQDRTSLTSEARLSNMASTAISFAVLAVLALCGQSAFGRGLLQAPVSGAANATAASSTATATSGPGSIYCQVWAGACPRR